MRLSPKDMQAKDAVIDYGVGFAYVRGQLIVRQLYAGSDAARFLLVGDHVITWAGRSYESLTQQGYCDFVQEESPQADLVLIVVERAGERLAVTITIGKTE